MKKLIACSLSSADREDRAARWQELARTASIEISETANGLRLSFRAEAETELRALAALERECCAFADWTVSVDGDVAVLDITAEGDAILVTQTLFARLQA
jgi:hypothetical protein